jgi:hypothetical protein
MEYLVDCQCSHDLSLHDHAGCRGSGCFCRRTKRQALDAAIEDARKNPWAAYLRPDALRDRAEEPRSA